MTPPLGWVEGTCYVYFSPLLFLSLSLSSRPRLCCLPTRTPPPPSASLGWQQDEIGRRGCWLSLQRAWSQSSGTITRKNAGGWAIPAHGPRRHACCPPAGPQKGPSGRVALGALVPFRLQARLTGPRTSLLSVSFCPPGHSSGSPLPPSSIAHLPTAEAVEKERQREKEA